MAVSESDGKVMDKTESDRTNDKMSEKSLETNAEEKDEEVVSNGIAKTADASTEEKEPMDISEESSDNKSPKDDKSTKNSPAQSSGVKKRSSRSRSSRSSRSSSVDKPVEKEKIKEETTAKVKEETTAEVKEEKEAEFVKPKDESMSAGDFPGFESSPVPDLKKEQYIKLLRVSLGRDHDDEAMSQGANSDQMSIDNPPSVDSDNFTMGEGAPRRSTRAKKSLNVDMSSPEFRKPFDFGWTRELVYRSMHEGERTRRNADVYYYNSAGKKFRSYRDLHDYLSDGLEEKNFTFFKEPIGINDPTKEIIRGAKAKPPAKAPTEESAQKKPATPKLKPKPAPKSETPKTMPKVVFYKNNSNKNKNLSNKANLYKKRKSAGPDDVDAMSDTDWSPEQKQNGVKRPSDSDLSPPPEKKFKQIAMRNTSTELKENFMMNLNAGFTALLHAFQYLKVHELLRAVCVSQMWRHIASHRSLWETVRMKNSRVRDWDGFGQALRYHCTKNLDLRKMLLPETQEQTNQMWEEFGKAVAGLTHLKRIDFGRCTSQAIEIVAESNPQLESIVTLSLRSSEIDFKSIGNCVNLVELKLKSASGIEIKDLSALKNLKQLKVLALTTVKNLEGIEDALSESIENLELGDCTKFTQYFATDALPKLKNLKRLRLEKGQGTCPTIPILDAISDLPNLTQLELINFDIKPGFDTSLARCSNLKTLLIIPTYVTQSATTNHVVMGGVSKLSQSLTYFIWGLTLELLRVTDLFIDQVEGSKSKVANSSPGVKKASGDSIPILKPMTDVNEAKEGQSASQVDILGLPKLQRVLSTILPTTKIKILKVPFSATWRQTVTDSSSQ